jgi:hypothetical protein
LNYSSVTFLSNQGKLSKLKVFADFLAKLTLWSKEPCTSWSDFTSGSSNNKGGGAGLILESDEGSVVEVSLRFSFIATNNQEYIV